MFAQFNPRKWDHWFVFVLTSILSAAWCAPGNATPTTIDTSELSPAMGWFENTPRTPAPAGACNYMYVQKGTGGSQVPLFYYGYSDKCSERVNQHENVVVNMIRPFVNAYDKAVQDTVTAGERGQIIGKFIDWAETDEKLTGDACLAAISTVRNYAFYYFDLSKKVSGTAKTMEDCVIFARKSKGFKGACNKQGTAGKEENWLSVKATLMACGASTK